MFENRIDFWIADGMVMREIVGKILRKERKISLTIFTSSDFLLGTLIKLKN